MTNNDDTALNPKHRGLGRGLNALFEDEEAPYPQAEAIAEAAPKASGRITMSPDQLEPNPYQPRQLFKDETLNELAASIKEHGILQPLLVRPIPGHPEQYQIIAGERRWRASQIAQVHELPVIITDHDDAKMQEIALIENLQREELNPIDEAAGYQYMIDEYGYTQDQLAKKMSKSRSHISNMLRLNGLSGDVARYLANGKLSMGHARSLLGAPDAAPLVEKIVSGNLSVRETERLVAEQKRENDPEVDIQGALGAVDAQIRDDKPQSSAVSGGVGAAEPAYKKDPDTIALEEELSLSLGMAVSIDSADGMSGEMKIAFKSLDQLDEVLAKLSSNPLNDRLMD